MDVEDHLAQWDEEEEEVEILLDEEEDLKDLENLQDETLLLQVKLHNGLLDHNKLTDQINPVLILRSKLIHQLNNQNQIPHHIKVKSQNMNLRRKIHLQLNNHPKLLQSLMMMILVKRIRNFLSDSEMIKVPKIRVLTIVIQIYRDISRSRPNQSTTKKSNESTRTNNPGRGNNNRTGGFGRGGKEPHKPIIIDTIDKPREDPTDPNYKIRHLFYYFNIPWNKETEVIFREIGIDDDYKLIDFMGWSVIDMYTILIGTDSLKFSDKSSFEIRDMIVKLISNLKLIRQYFINVYQFKLDDQGNFESTIGLETITKFSRPTKMELDTFKDEHKNVHHLIEGMILDHEVFLNKSHITKSIAEFKNNVSTNHDKLQSVATQARSILTKQTNQID